MAIGEQRMGGVNVPGYPSGGVPKNSGVSSASKTTAAIKGLNDIFNTGAAIYGGIQEQRRKEAAQQQAVDIEGAVLDFEKSALEQSTEFQDAATNLPEARATESFDSNGSGALETDEMNAQMEYNKRRQRIMQSSLDPKKRSIALIDLQKNLMAKYPGALESIRDKIDDTRNRISVEDQLFASPEEYNEFQKMYPGDLNVNNYAKFKSTQAYLQEQTTYGKVTIDNLKRSGTAQVNVESARIARGFFNDVRENRQAFQDPTVFASTAEAKKQEAYDYVDQLANRARTQNVDPDEISSWVDSKRTEIDKDFQPFLESQNPIKALENANKVNDMLVENHLWSIIPGTMAFAAKDSTGQTMMQLITLANSDNPNKDRVFREFMGEEWNVQEAERALNFFNKLQDPDFREEFLVQSPYAASSIGAANGANGGDSDDAEIMIRGMEESYTQYGPDSQQFSKSLSNIGSNRRVSLFVERQATPDQKLRLKSKVEGAVGLIAQRTQLGSGLEQGAVLSYQNGLPVISVPAMTGGGREQKIQYFKDKEATATVQGMYNLYSSAPSLGDPKEFLDSVFEVGEVPAPQARSSQAPTPNTSNVTMNIAKGLGLPQVGTPATNQSNLVEEVEDFVASRESLATLDTSRSRRIMNNQREVLKSRYNIDDSQLNAVVKQLEDGVPFEEIVESLPK